MNATREGDAGAALQRRLLVVTRLLIVLLGVLAAWTWRFTPNPDGVSYVDISAYYLEGNWPLSNTGYWSPLYPSLLAAARLLGGTDIRNAWVLAHVLNLLLFLSGIAAAEYFVRSVRAVTPHNDPRSRERMFTWTVLVYFLVAWTSLSWVTLRLVTPDLAVTALIYVAAGLSVRIVHDESRIHQWVVLGTVLGLGYLTKTVMLPIGVAIIAAVALNTSNKRRSRRSVAMAATVFLVVCVPQVVYVSLLKGAPTFGDVGRLAHAWYTARVPPPLANLGTGILPASLPSPNGPRQELRALDAVMDQHPMVYAVDGPFQGTLPIWYDATHWYRHVEVPIALRETIAGTVRHSIEYVRRFSIFLLVAAVALIKSRPSRVASWSSPAVRVLMMPALFALALYALSYSEPRYIAPFAVLLLAGVVLPSAADQRMGYMRLGFTAGALLFFLFAVAETVALFKERKPYERAQVERSEVVEKLRAMGIVAGTRIGYVGDPYTAYWAQLAELRFVSVIPAPEADFFWAADSLARAAVLQLMRDHGASAILAHEPERRVPREGWIQVASDSSLLLYRMR